MVLVFIQPLNPNKWASPQFTFYYEQSLEFIKSIFVLIFCNHAKLCKVANY